MLKRFVCVLVVGICFGLCFGDFRARATETEPLYYDAVLSQNGTNDPVATVMRNTLGGIPVWARIESGEYQAYLEGAFPPERTFIQISAMTSGLSLETAPNTGDTVTYSVKQINFDDLALQNKDNHRVAISVIVYP